MANLNSLQYICLPLRVKTLRVTREHASPPNVTKTQVKHDDTLQTDTTTGMRRAS